MAKRKRGGATRKPVSRKAPAVKKKEEETKKAAPQAKKSSAVVGQNEEAFLDFVNQNNKGNSVCEDSNDYEVNNQSGSGSDIPLEASSGSPVSSSSESDEPYNVEDSSDDSPFGKRSRKSGKSDGKEKKKSRKLSKNLTSSRDLLYSSRQRKELKTSHQFLQANKKELKAALGVIKKIMTMDEAQPFNVPVDPVALGKPDYLDIIDTPMDFNTICSNLQNNVKYMNSEEVLKDVKCIWKNCFKYNKKGEYIVYLAKRVEKKFMKYWIAAGLYNKPSRKSHENLFRPPADLGMRQNAYEQMHHMGYATDGINQIHQNRMDPYLPHRQWPPSSYSQPYQSQQPPPPPMWPPQFSQFPPSRSSQLHQFQHPQPSTNQPQYSQLHPYADCSNAGNSRFQSPPDPVRKQKNCPPSSSLRGPSSHKQPAAKQQPQQSTSHAQVSQLPQQSTSHAQASQLRAAVDTRHSHMPPHTDYVTNTGYVLWGPSDPVAASPVRAQPMSNARSSEPRQLPANNGQAQSSWFQSNADIEHSLTDSAMKGINCALKYSAAPVSENSDQGKEDELDQAENQPEQTLLEQNQGDQLLLSARKNKKGRGPTRCRFLNDLPDGERIAVPLNKLGQPIGPESSKLVSFLGTVARNGHMAPLTYVQWRHMPDSIKQEMWEHVQSKFDVDLRGKPWVMKSIATKWRDWKAELKAKHYYPHETDEERLKDIHPRIIPDQWPFLVSYWNTENAQKLCATNRANRLKVKATHASGQKSFARIREEERIKRPDGKEPTRAELYILTHTRRDGQPVDEAAAENIAKLREFAAKKQEDSDCSDNDTFGQVMGEDKGGYLRTYGLGPTREDVYGPRSSRELEKIASDVKKSANEEVSRVLEKMEVMEQKYAKMENQITFLTTSMQKFFEKFAGAGPSNVLGTEQALNNTPNSPQNLYQPRLGSSSSSHAGANGEAYA